MKKHIEIDSVHTAIEKNHVKLRLQIFWNEWTQKQKSRLLIDLIED